MDSTEIFIRPGGPRPDFRLFMPFLWGEGRDVDTFGNCEAGNPADRSWTELYVRDREGSEERFEIWPVEGSDPLVLRVSSPRPDIAARAAWFLATETDGTWADTPEGPPYSPHALVDRLGTDFDLATAAERAACSIWRKATPDAPYPNLSG